MGSKRLYAALAILALMFMATYIIGSGGVTPGLVEAGPQLSDPTATTTYITITTTIPPGTTVTPECSNVSVIKAVREDGVLYVMTLIRQCSDEDRGVSLHLELSLRESGQGLSGFLEAWVEGIQAEVRAHRVPVSVLLNVGGKWLPLVEASGELVDATGGYSFRVEVEASSVSSVSNVSEVKVYSPIVVEGESLVLEASGAVSEYTPPCSALLSIEFNRTETKLAVPEDTRRLSLEISTGNFSANVLAMQAEGYVHVEISLSIAASREALGSAGERLARIPGWLSLHELIEGLTQEDVNAVSKLIWDIVPRLCGGGEPSYAVIYWNGETWNSSIKALPPPIPTSTATPTPTRTTTSTVTSTTMGTLEAAQKIRTEEYQRAGTSRPPHPGLGSPEKLAETSLPSWMKLLLAAFAGLVAAIASYIILVIRV